VQQRSSRGRQGGKGAYAKPPPGDPVETGLRLLSRRDHSREELRRKLSQRGHEKQAIDEAIQRIHKSYALDDQAFARSYVRRRSSAKGPVAIAGELAARGIDRASTEAALAEFGAAQQLQAATLLAFRLYARQREDLGYRQVLDKIGSKLLRRGFSTTIARAACHSLLRGTAQPPED
jgi:regulatory protein